MNVDIIGVPIDLGASRRGVDMGPSAIRYAGLEKALIKIGVNPIDLGNIDVKVRENIKEDDYPYKGYWKEITRVNTLLSQMVKQSLVKEHLPLILGGDHSIAIGSILGSQAVRKNIGVLWVDAHGDYNTHQTSLSGNLHGMSLAASAGNGLSDLTEFKSPDTKFIDPKKIVLVGIRDIDDEEAVLIKKDGVTVFTMTDIDMYGMREVMHRALSIVSADTNGFHLSFDMDVITPHEAPGVGTPVHGGISYREAHLAVEMIADNQQLCSIEFVEVNPILDHKNQTGSLAVSLISSVLGKRII